MSRTDRNRQAEFREALDQRNRDGPATTQRMAVQIYDGGSIPTTVPRVYLSHPVMFTSDDVEGASYSATVDTDTVIPVVCIGPVAPRAGDILIAHGVGGRWVCDKHNPRGGPPPVCTSPCAACPDGLPRTLKVTDANGSWELVYNPGLDYWWGFASGAVARKDGSLNCGFAHSGTVTYALQVICTDSGLVLNRLWQNYFDEFGSGGCCDGTLSPGFLAPAGYVDYSPDNPCTGASSSFTFTPDDCVAFSVSGSLAWTSAAPDPWGLGVTIEGPVTDPGSCCSPCPIPQHDLTLHWTNSIIGAGSVTLTFSADPDTWTSACSHQIVYTLSCSGADTILSVDRYPAADCPSGTPNTCTSTGTTPHRLTLDSYACIPLSLTYSLTNTTCPDLWSNGFSQFQVTDP